MLSAMAIIIGMSACKPKNAGTAVNSDAASKECMLPPANTMNFITSFPVVSAGSFLFMDCQAAAFLELFPYFLLTRKKAGDTVKKQNLC